MSLAVRACRFSPSRRTFPKPKAELRLPPMMDAYLEDLAKICAYGKGKSGVMRRFIENGIRTAIERKVILARDVADFAEGSDGEEDA